MKNVFKPVILVFSFLALLSACESKAPAAISVTLSPNTASVHVTRTLQLTPTVHNSTNGSVTWSLSGSGCSGATCGTISSAGLYAAPTSVPNPATVTVRATSAADTSKSASATITILPAVVVTVSPLDQSIDLCKTLQFTATVQNAIDSSVTWSISGPDCTGTGCGTISTTGLYTAPCAASTMLTITVTATSVEDSTISDSVTMTVVSNAWTWVSGSNIGNQLGIYGTKGTAAPSNVPGGRDSAVSWIDSHGNLWLFGEIGLDSAGYYGLLNDLWKYDPTTLEWTWVSGSNIGNQAGIYGTKGTAAPSNVPGGRDSSVSWIDSNGKLWLFGGAGLFSSGGWDYFNDLWRYTR